MMRRPYGVRISRVGTSPEGRVGNHRSASSATPSAILATRSRSTETARVSGGGSFRSGPASRLSTVIVVFPS